MSTDMRALNFMGPFLNGILRTGSCNRLHPAILIRIGLSDIGWRRAGQGTSPTPGKWFSLMDQSTIQKKMVSGWNGNGIQELGNGSIISKVMGHGIIGKSISKS